MKAQVIICAFATFAIVWQYVEAQANCGNINTCGACTDQSKCVWCNDATGNTGSCKDGDFFGPNGIFTFCSRWYYRQCYFNGRWMYYFVFILIFLCVCCCCAAGIWYLFCGPNIRNKLYNPVDIVYAKWEDMKRSQEMKEMDEASQRREEIRSKYGLD